MKQITQNYVLIIQHNGGLYSLPPTRFEKKLSIKKQLKKEILNFLTTNLRKTAFKFVKYGLLYRVPFL